MRARVVAQLFYKSLFVTSSLQDQIIMFALKLQPSKGITFFRISNTLLQLSFYERARKVKADLHGTTLSYTTSLRQAYDRSTTS